MRPPRVVAFFSCCALACSASNEEQRDFDAIDRFGVTADELREMANTWEEEELRLWMREHGILRDVSLSQHTPYEATAIDAEVGELGELRQATYSDDEYGVEQHGAALPCTVVNGWAGGFCLAPSSNTMHENVANLCGIRGGACPEGWREAIDDAIDSWVNTTRELSDEGGAWVWGRNGRTGGIEVEIFRSTGADSFATTTVSVNELIPGLLDDIEKCSEHPVGRFCQYKRTPVHLHPEVFERNAVYQNADAFGKFAMVSNIVRHELGHVAGLGHRDTVQLMASGSTPGIQSAFTELLFSPTAREMTMMCRYNPNADEPRTPCEFNFDGVVPVSALRGGSLASGLLQVIGGR